MTSTGQVRLALDAVEAQAAASGGQGKREYVRRIFSEIAPRYDLLNHVLSLNIDRGWRRAAIAALGWQRQPEGTYLDLCAGTTSAPCSRGLLDFGEGWWGLTLPNRCFAAALERPTQASWRR
jgi:hypothetical protein